MCFQLSSSITPILGPIFHGSFQTGTMFARTAYVWICLCQPLFWVNYNELTTSSLEIIVSKENHPQMALIQVSELL